MKYVYPKLSNVDLLAFRIGGLGLGNMMLTYARALVFARDHQAEVIWPTWPALPIGQIVRRETPKRFYNDAFADNGPFLSGWKKGCLLLSKKKVLEDVYLSENPDRDDWKILTVAENDLENKILVFHGMRGEFSPILGKKNSEFIYQNLCSILQDHNRKALLFEPGRAIVMHVRLGDFTKATEAELKSGIMNGCTPVEWYVSIVKQIRNYLGENIPVYVFSDGKDIELQKLLEQSNVFRKDFGSAIADIMAMSQAKLFVGSGSTFSRWVRYLGRMNAILYPGQLRQNLLDKDEYTFEIETEELSEKDLQRIKDSLLFQSKKVKLQYETNEDVKEMRGSCEGN